MDEPQSFIDIITGTGTDGITININFPYSGVETVDGDVKYVEIGDIGFPQPHAEVTDINGDSPGENAGAGAGAGAGDNAGSGAGKEAGEGAGASAGGGAGKDAGEGAGSAAGEGAGEGAGKDGKEKK